MIGLNNKRPRIKCEAPESPTIKLPAQSEPDAAPPTSRAKCDMTIGYALRNHLVMVPLATKPTATCYKKERKYTPSRQTLTCAERALEHYNSMNQGDEHELVEAVASNAFSFNGMWIHVNFLAKLKGAASCVVLGHLNFFAELKSDNKGLSCVSCVKMDSGNPRNLGGCGACPHRILHPAAGGYRNAKPIQKVAARKKCIVNF